TQRTSIITETHKGPNDEIPYIYGQLQMTSKGNQYVLSIQNVLTKYLILVPFPNQQAQTKIEKLADHYIYVFSTPKTILIDQGLNFVSKLMMEFEETFKIKHINTTSFHPQGNGSLEWDEILNLVCFGYNTSCMSISRIPFELTFGTKAYLTSAIAATNVMSKEEEFRLWKRRHELYLARAKVIIEKSKATNKRNQNKEIKLQNVFKVNDRILMHNDRKGNNVDSEWLGLYIIDEMKLKLLATLTLVISEEIKLADLENKNLFLEDVQKVFLSYNQVKLIVGVDMKSISKTLFGTLENSDLELINQNIDKLFNANNKIVRDQTLMTKHLLKLSSVEKQIVHVIDIPILEWKLRKCYPIPKKTGTIFSAIIIPETLTLQTIYDCHWNRPKIFGQT
ncbi:unnamed protein product, partial [Heterotrigona itama]